MKIEAKEDNGLRLGIALYKKGRKHAMTDEFVDGISCMLEALHYLEPLKGKDHRVLRAECLYFLGMMEIWRGRYGTAHDVLEECTNLNPDVPVYWAYFAQACMYLGADRKAMRFAEKIDSFDHADAVVFSMLQTIWEFYKDFTKAEVFKEKATKGSTEPDALYLLGNSHYIKSEKKQAGEYYRKALDIDPEHKEANYAYGLIIAEEGRHAEAIPYFTKGMESTISGHSAHWGRSISNLILGNYKDGFEDYEMRILFMKHEYGTKIAEMRHDKPQWNGETEPARIHVYSEQGFGDFFQFCRYVPLLCGMGHEVILECDTSMLELMKYNFPKANVIPLALDFPKITGIPDCDYRIAIGSLPYAFKSTLESLPFSDGYLKAQPEKIIEHSIIADKKKVGLCWAGGKRFQDRHLVEADERRSISFATISPILEDKDYDFFSLQAGQAAEQGNIYDLMKDVKSWSDTAGIIANLDLVISVDTAVLHLAAAMGKETWLLNKEHTCWRWLLDRTDSPWYHSLRIFRYKTGWDQVVNDAREALWQR